MRTLLFSLIAFVTFVPVAVFAQENLVNLPIGETGDFNDYINAIYLMFISIAALIAVIKIIIAGVKYMFSDIVTQKSEAKRDIQGALLGLLVVLAAVVVLTIINPDLTTFDPEISRIQEVVAPPPSNGGGSGEVTALMEYCEDTPGNCERRACDALDEYVEEAVAGYALVGAAGGAYAGSFFGPASLATVPIFSVVGTIAGGYTGYRINQLASSGECLAVCSWLDGEIQNNNGTDSCLFPTDSDALNQAELEATRQALREQYNCLDGRLIILNEVNCIRDVSSEESEFIFNSLGIEVGSDLAESINIRVREAQLQNRFITDQAEIESLRKGIIGAENVVLAIEVPNTDTSDVERMIVENNFRGICTDSGFDDVDIAIGNTNYITCVQ